jgi:hypothetical protein
MLPLARSAPPPGPPVSPSLAKIDLGVIDLGVIDLEPCRTLAAKGEPMRVHATKPSVAGDTRHTKRRRLRVQLTPSMPGGYDALFVLDAPHAPPA